MLDLGRICRSYGATHARWRRGDGSEAVAEGAGGSLQRAVDTHGVGPLAAALASGEGLCLRDGDVELRCVTSREPDDREVGDLRLAWDLCRNVTSNAIVFVKDRRLVGCGAGQMSRVDSVELAAGKAGELARGAVMASDAFFPFPDGVLAAAAAGVKAVIQPGGSIRDQEVVRACDEAGIAMVFTGRRHFRH